MNWDQVKGTWGQLKGRFRQQWGKFTDDELERLAGNKDEFLGRLREKYGYGKEEAERQVNDFLRGLHLDEEPAGAPKRP